MAASISTDHTGHSTPEVGQRGAGGCAGSLGGSVHRVCRVEKKLARVLDSQVVEQKAFGAALVEGRRRLHASVNLSCVYMLLLAPYGTGIGIILLSVF